MQFRRTVILGFLVLSLIALWDMTRPAGHGFGGMVTRQYVRIEGQQGRFPVQAPDFMDERALEPVTGVRSVTISGVSGGLELVRSDTDAVTASYSIRLWSDGDRARLAETAAMLARQLAVAWVQDGDSARLTIYPPDQLPEGIRAMRVSLRVAVPDGVAVATQHTGETRVDGVNGAVRLEHSGGDVVVRRVTGPVDISSSFATVEVSGVEGALNVQLMGGPVRVRDLNGSVQGGVRLGTLDLAAVHGDVTFTVHQGRAEVVDVSGSVNLSTSYGEVEIDRVAGDVRLDHSFGEANVRGVTRAADISVRYGEAAVVLRGNGGWNVEATAQLGSLETDLPLRRESSELRTAVSGVIGDGAHDVRIEVYQGALRLSRR